MTNTDHDALIIELLGHGAADLGLLRARIATRLGAMATPKKPVVTGRLRALAAEGKVSYRPHDYSPRIPGVWRRA